MQKISHTNNYLLIESSTSCFPAIATVQLENGNLVTMSELQIGDRVKTGKHSFLFKTKPHGQNNL